MPRYIDADALYDRFQNLACDDWNQGTGTTWANAYAEAADVVDDMPTADVAPVRHGEWIYGEDEFGIDGYRCDKCGFFVPWNYASKNISYIKDYHYCPNCGAKMDGGATDVENDGRASS